MNSFSTNTVSRGCREPFLGEHAVFTLIHHDRGARKRYPAPRQRVPLICDSLIHIKISMIRSEFGLGASVSNTVPFKAPTYLLCDGAIA